MARWSVTQKKIQEATKENMGDSDYYKNKLIKQTIKKKKPYKQGEKTKSETAKKCITYMIVTVIAFK